MNKTWKPALPDGGTIHERLIAALERDIAAGVLQAGVRLPPHRDLAHDLGIGVGTVTKAYADAEQRGLLTAHVGRGSFVADTSKPVSLFDDHRTPRIDMANNLPPLAGVEARINDTLGQLRRRGDLGAYMGYASAGGMDSHRRAMAAWITRTTGFDDVNADDLVLTTGAQEAASLAAAHLCKPGDTILCEAATFFGFRNLAACAGYSLQAVAMDNEGLDPAALDRAAKKGARVLYTIPTLQNPTGSTMSTKRRAEIVRIARARDLWILEDDVYGSYADGAPTPLAMLAPERTFYISSVSKTLAPGLRAGFMRVPSPEHREAIIRVIRARSVSGSALGSLIAMQWIEDGTADAVLAANRTETAARMALARDILGKAAPAPASPYCSHIWLPMSEVEAERLAARTAAANVDLTAPSAPLVDSALISGVRLCLGAVRSRASLETGLRTIAAALTGASESAKAMV